MTSHLNHAGYLIAKCLQRYHVKTAFLVPGESYLPIIEGIHDATSIDLVTCRRESGAAMMAEAYAKTTGEVGIALVTRGPGATNASSGLHIAMQDSTPLILFVGQVGNNFYEREAFQEIDYIRFFNPLCKWVTQINDASRIEEYMQRAFYTALSGRPGPVVVVLPQDMLNTPITFSDRSIPQLCLPKSFLSENDKTHFSTLLSQACNPLIVCGGHHWDATSKTQIEKFSKQNHIALYTAFRRQDYIDNTHPHYGGNLSGGLSQESIEAFKSADLIILLGTRFGETSSCGYTLLNIPCPTQKIIHVYPDATELGKLYAPTLPIISDSRNFVASISDIKLPHTHTRENFCQSVHQLYQESLDHVVYPQKQSTARIIKTLNETLSKNTILCNGAGNYAAFLHRYYQHVDYPTQLAPISGSMGYALPAAIATKMAYPDKPVLSISGDGCFMMEAQEMSVATERKMAITCIVINNSGYGTIRMYQEKRTPHSTPATHLHNPDFVKLAQSHGWLGYDINDENELKDVLRKTSNNNIPTLIEIKTDINDLSPNFFKET